MMGHQVQIHVKPPSLLTFSVFTWISTAFDPHIPLLCLTLKQPLSQFNSMFDVPSLDLHVTLN